MQVHRTCHQRLHIEQLMQTSIILCSPRCAVRPAKCRIILGDRRCIVQILRQTKQEAGQRGPPTFVFKQTRSDRTDAFTSANPSQIPSDARESSLRIGTSAAIAADQCLSQSKVRNGTWQRFDAVKLTQSERKFAPSVFEWCKMTQRYFHGD